MKILLNFKITTLFLLFSAYCSYADPINIYVSPNGSDSWQGISEVEQSPNGPFLTLTKVREVVRELINNNTDQEDIIVNFMEGKYYFDEALILNANDSGTTNFSITYQAYENEKVIFTGGIKLSGFEVAETIENMNEAAVGNIFHVNLKELGITDYGSLLESGERIDIIYNQVPMTLARWPNNTLSLISSVNEDEAVGEIGYDHDRAKYWVSEPELLTQGYWYWDWANEIQLVESIDLSNKVLNLAQPYHNYGYKAGQRYFILNALYELDSPGEWYLNRSTGDLYIWPPDGKIDDAYIEISSLPTLIKFQYASWISIEGIQFSGTKDYPISIFEGNNVQIKKCTISNSGVGGVDIRKGVQHSVIGCDIANTAERGIIVRGGDRETLEHSYHLLENNYIHNFARIDRTYNPAIELQGVGAIAKNNTIHNSPHTAILLVGNNHTVEFNEIFDVVYETSDAGAIYSGRDWSARGNQITNNYIHHISGYRDRLNIGVYLDDQASGFNITNNLFFEVNIGILVGGGDDNLIDSNTFISTATIIDMDDRGLNVQTETSAAGEQLISNLQDVPYTSSIWTSAYPKLAISLEDIFAPTGNIITNNLSERPLTFDIHEEAENRTSIKENNVSNNISYSLSNGNITNITDTTFTLESVGVFRDIYRITWPINKYRRVEEE
ncbi:right-handed parallel beta-helix repeat-containing protein [Paraglaciecola marina]|uniref:right-handed parallel beta-helix repeat-containing protein n=1 Tax=Paraglaciecola marina TaxID=2500157 RepID=UPI0014150DF2|nr:right-handed parallel beta-helix repeat-containing protein [Paraglaciecola marina]